MTDSLQAAARRRAAGNWEAGHITETEFWDHLEDRVSRDLIGIAENRRCEWWCDGFVPDEYDFESEPPCVRGDAWICRGSDQQPWRFELVLDRASTSIERVDWSALVPRDDATEWLALDFAARCVELEPRAALRAATDCQDVRRITRRGWNP